jgi:hypothetical protein
MAVFNRILTLGFGIIVMPPYEVILDLIVNTWTKLKDCNKSLKFKGFLVPSLALGISNLDEPSILHITKRRDLH